MRPTCTAQELKILRTALLRLGAYPAPISRVELVGPPKQFQISPSFTEKFADIEDKA